jgi:hypothetical protein
MERLSSSKNPCIDTSPLSVVLFNAYDGDPSLRVLGGRFLYGDFLCSDERTNATTTNATEEAPPECWFPTTGRSDVVKTAEWHVSVVASSSIAATVRLIVGFVASPLPPLSSSTMMEAVFNNGTWWGLAADATHSPVSLAPNESDMTGFLSIVAPIASLIAYSNNNTTIDLTLRIVSPCATVDTLLSISIVPPTDPPRGSVTVATQAAVTTAATASAVLGGDVVTAASLVLLSLISCSKLAPNPGASAYVMSVFYDHGPVAMVFGNIGLVCLVFLIHYVVVVMATKLGGWSSLEAGCAMLRYPALSIRVNDFLLTGTTFAALLAFWSSDAGALVAGVIGVVAVVSAVIGAQVYYFRFVQPHCTFHLYPTSHQVGRLLERQLLFPCGAWGGPHGVRNRFLPLMGAFIPRRELARTLLWSPSLGLAVLSATASSGVGCGSGPWIVGIAHVFVAFVVAFVLRPFRLPSDGLLGPVGTLLVGVACILKTSSDATLLDASDSVTTAVGGVQLLRTMVALWMRRREEQLRDLMEGADFNATVQCHVVAADDRHSLTMLAETASASTSIDHDDMEPNTQEMDDRRPADQRGTTIDDDNEL